MTEPTLPTSPFFTSAQAAAYINRPLATLRVWRHRRQGPPSFKQGRKVMYRIAALDAWLAECEAADSRSNAALDPLTAPPQPRRIRPHPTRRAA